jgi:hypothetical protein
MLYNGVDGSAVRRAHMRALTMARQVAERHLGYPPIRRGSDGFHEQVAARLVEVRAELAEINATHRTWLRAHGEEE